MPVDSIIIAVGALIAGLTVCSWGCLRGVHARLKVEEALLEQARQALQGITPQQTLTVAAPAEWLLDRCGFQRDWELASVIARRIRRCCTIEDGALGAVLEPPVGLGAVGQHGRHVAGLRGLSYCQRQQNESDCCRPGTDANSRDH